MKFILYDLTCYRLSSSTYYLTKLKLSNTLCHTSLKYFYSIIFLIVLLTDIDYLLCHRDDVYFLLVMIVTLLVMIVLLQFDRNYSVSVAQM